MFFGWQKIFLILTVLPTCGCLEVSIQEKEYEVASGEDVTLTCSFVPARPELTNFVLRWEANPDNAGDPSKPVATYFMNSRPDIAPPYEGRATLNVNVEQRVSSLVLARVTIADSRQYQCSVLIPNDDEGTTAASTSLLVLVPPSTPICRVQGTAEYFNNITLTCDSKEGSPKPTYDWKTFSVENLPRPFPPKTIKKDAELSLFNISKETSGFFICTSVNRIGSASCNLTLAVMPPSMNIGSTAGIIVGVVAGLLLLAIILYCFCRKKGNKDTYEKGSPREMEFYDKDASEAGEQYADDRSKRDNKQAVDYSDSQSGPQNSYAVRQKLDDDEYSKCSDMDKGDRHQERDRFEDAEEQYGGNRDRLNDRNNYRGSRDRLDDTRNDYRGSRDRLDDTRNDYRGSRDRLDDARNDYRGSRDRLDDSRNDYRGSRDRLDDSRNDYRGSRDRLDDSRNDYRGSRDRLDDSRNDYRGSRDRLDDSRNDYRGSRDRLDDSRNHYRGSRDRLDYTDEPY